MKYPRLPIACGLYLLFCASVSTRDRIFTVVTLGEAANPSPDFSPSAFSHRTQREVDNGVSPEEVDLGTTLVAIKYSGGVIVGADTRTSVGGYVSNKFAYKINPIFDSEDEYATTLLEDAATTDDEEDARSKSSSCVLCRSGSAADTQWLARLAKRRFQIRKLERPGYRPSISEVAHYLRYQMRNSQGGGDFQASLICAGYEASTRGGQIFGITPGGSLWEEENFCVSGSGSTILLGYLDDALQHATKNNFAQDLTEDQAIALVVKLLRLSIARDGSSGGLVRLYVVNQNGLEERTVYPFSDLTKDSIAKATDDSEKTADAVLKGFAKPSR